MILKSNILLVIVALLVSSCNPAEYVSTEYKSNVKNYEQKVAENKRQAEQRLLAKRSPAAKAPQDVQIIVNNPFNPPANTGLLPVTFSQNAVPINLPLNARGVNLPVSSNPYSSLSSGVIQPGAIMANQAPIYAPATSFGSNVYRPSGY